MQDALQNLVQDLQSIHPLIDTEADALLSLLDQSVRRFEPGSVLAAAETILLQPYFIKSGWLYTSQVLDDGRQQILDFYTAGEVAAPATLFLEKTNVNVVAMTPVQVVSVPRCALQDIMLRHPALGGAFAKYLAKSTLAAGDWVTTLGRRSAYERVAMLLLYVAKKHAHAHGGGGTRLDFRCTQSIVADALGLSVVHANRTIRTLEREKVVDWQRNHIVIRRPERLQDIVDGKAGSEQSDSVEKLVGAPST
jgi:CRP-like cAMP-binding protein